MDLGKVRRKAARCNVDNITRLGANKSMKICELILYPHLCLIFMMQGLLYPFYFDGRAFAEAVENAVWYIHPCVIVMTFSPFIYLILTTPTSTGLDVYCTSLVRWL